MKLKKFELISNLIKCNEICIGMTRTEVESCLGKPDDISIGTRKYKVPPIWKYGDVEFVFPPAKNEIESRNDGLLYVYVDDGVVKEPIFLLKD